MFQTRMESIYLNLNSDAIIFKKYLEELQKVT